MREMDYGHIDPAANLIQWKQGKRDLRQQPGVQAQCDGQFIFGEE